MASTRNKNTPGNYALEQRQRDEWRSHAHLYGHATHTMLPGQGLLPGHIHANQLADNATDIESFLRGIRATDLVQPRTTPFHASVLDLPSLHCYPRPSPAMLPEPLTILPRQRPSLI